MKALKTLLTSASVQNCTFLHKRMMFGMEMMVIRTIAATWDRLSQKQLTTTEKCKKKKITEVHKTVSGGKKKFTSDCRNSLWD